MKTLNESFSDADFRKLTKAKRIFNEKTKHSYSWAKFIMTLSKGVSVRRKGNGSKK